jgi:hypothetical protein
MLTCFEFHEPLRVTIITYVPSDVLTGTQCGQDGRGTVSSFERLP